MLPYIFLFILGLSSGTIIAGGVAGLLIGLGIVPRFAGITHTAEHIFLYEDCALLGTIIGNICFLFPFSIPFGVFFLIVCGLFFGIFLGSWILSLAEVADIFPVFSRRIRLKSGLPLIIVSVALGKCFGALLFYWLGWHL